MNGTVAPGSCPWVGLGVGAGASVYCGHNSSFFFFFLQPWMNNWFETLTTKISIAQLEARLTDPGVSSSNPSSAT